MLAALAAAALVSWLALRSPRIDRDRVYRIGYGHDLPVHFRGPDGQPAGLAVELVQEAARRTGLKLEWREMGGFDQDLLDFWVLQTIRPERIGKVYLSEPYLQTESCFLVLADGPVHSLADLRTARVTHPSAAILRDTLAQLLPEAQRISTGDSAQAVEQLLRGTADAAFIDQYAVITSLLRGGEFPALRILATHSPRRSLALASTFANAAVADELRRGMQSMADDGSIKAIAERWTFFPNLTADVIGDLANAERRSRWLTFGIAGLSMGLVLMVGLAAWSQHQTRKLRRTENLLRNVADRVPGVVYQFRLNPDGTSCFPYASEAIRQFYRASPESVRTDARDVAAVLHPDDLDSFTQSIQRSAQTLTPWVCEYRVKFPDDTVRWLLGNARPQREANGATLWHGFITDITERKAAEATLQMLERKIQETQKLESLGVLAGGIAHDFNNILTSILGNTSLAAIDLPGSSPAQNYLESIKRGCLRASDLCQQMLAYSGKGRFVVTKISLNQLVEDTTQLLQLSIGKHATLRFNLAPGLPPFEGDATQIRQVIMNLVINASEAIGPQSGVISISTGLMGADRDYLAGTVLAPELAPGTYLSLEVSDNGCGMSAETQAKIFDPFFTTNFTGRGLGLAAVLGIVRGHQGALKVYSEPGRGTTFKVLFPSTTGSADPGRGGTPR